MKDKPLSPLLLCCLTLTSFWRLYMEKRSWGVVTNYGEEGEGYKTGGWGPCEVYPYNKKGGRAEKVLAMLSGVTNVLGSFNG